VEAKNAFFGIFKPTKISRLDFMIVMIDVKSLKYRIYNNVKRLISARSKNNNAPIRANVPFKLGEIFSSNENYKTKKSVGSQNSSNDDFLTNR